MKKALLQILPPILLWITWTILINPEACDRAALAQSFRCAGTEFNAQRSIQVPADRKFSVVVVEFYHHGEIRPDGTNVLVATSRLRPVPTRLLQLGPGDFCRVAFETQAGESQYVVLYGGAPPEKSALAPWTNRDGLVFEARRYSEVNLWSFEEVRKAFEAAEPIGADYVEGVLHGYNPVSPRPEPFFSKYSGYLHISNPGTYGFYVSSEDCSFLLIDGKLVAEAPGRHRPERVARPGMRRDIRLEAGPHRFEYYHAAAGPTATMVVAWEFSPAGSQPKPEAIPGEAFRTWAIGRVDPGPPTSRKERLLPEFRFEVTGDVPLPDNDQPLVGVQFVNTSPEGLFARGKAAWEFGDGQTSEDPKPFHVYLRPGIYAVRLMFRRGADRTEIVQRISVDPYAYVATRRQQKTQTLPTIDTYLPVLATYDATKLDAAALRQLVSAFQWKANLILAPPRDAQGQTTPPEQPGEELSPQQRLQQIRDLAAKWSEATKYFRSAVAAGQAAFLGESVAKGDQELLALARLIGPMARNLLGDSESASRIWLGAADRIAQQELKGECELEAADILLNDLLNREAAKKWLESASSRLASVTRGPVASKLARVWGDYHAALGEGEASRKRYLQAEKLLESPRTYIERIAWQGAHSRSTEEFLQTQQWERAAEQLRQWEGEFPADKIDGYLTLLFAQYWRGRKLYPQAVALAEQLLAVNRDSPHVDQLLLLAARCRLEQKRVEEAIALLSQLVREYPGSPLVPEAKSLLDQLEGRAVGRGTGTRQ